MVLPNCSFLSRGVELEGVIYIPTQQHRVCRCIFTSIIDITNSHSKNIAITVNIIEVSWGLSICFMLKIVFIENDCTLLYTLFMYTKQSAILNIVNQYHHYHTKIYSSISIVVLGKKIGVHIPLPDLSYNGCIYWAILLLVYICVEPFLQ